MERGAGDYFQIQMRLRGQLSRLRLTQGKPLRGGQPIADPRSTRGLHLPQQTAAA